MTIEVVVLSVFVFLAGFLVNPYWMPGNMEMTAVTLLVVAFVGFAGLVLRERARDEREEAHRAFAGRMGFLAGMAVLTLGIVLQALAHKLDPWLLWALFAMAAAKLVALLYGKLRQ